MHDRSTQVPAQERGPVWLIPNARSMRLRVPCPKHGAGEGSTSLGFRDANRPLRRAGEHQPGHGTRLLPGHARRARVSEGCGRAQMQLQHRSDNGQSEGWSKGSSGAKGPAHGGGSPSSSPAAPFPAAGSHCIQAGLEKRSA